MTLVQIRIASVEPYRGAALNGAIRLERGPEAVPNNLAIMGRPGQELKMVILHVD